MKTRTLLILVALAAVAPITGCMSSRSRCEIQYENTAVVIPAPAEVNTGRKYTIREIRGQPRALSRTAPVLREVADSIALKERVMQTCPGVFEREGSEIFVDIVSCSTSSAHRWTAIPCFLTVGICPYFQKDDTEVTAEVYLVSDPSKKARFTYRLVDDWKISFLFRLGSIPYTADILENVSIGKRGHGDISGEVHREGFAVGIAKALKEIERNH